MNTGSSKWEQMGLLSYTHSESSLLLDSGRTATTAHVSEICSSLSTQSHRPPRCCCSHQDPGLLSRMNRGEPFRCVSSRLRRTKTHAKTDDPDANHQGLLARPFVLCFHPPHLAVQKPSLVRKLINIDALPRFVFTGRLPEFVDKNDETPGSYTSTMHQLMLFLDSALMLLP